MSNVKVVLIRPPYVIPKTSIFGQRGTPSLGLAYLSAIVHQLGQEIVCIDAYALNMDKFEPVDEAPLFVNGLSNSEIIRLIPSDSDIIGISCMFSSEWINTSKLLKAVKNQFPQAILVLGGEHVTADFEYILKKYHEVDFCILGEGEEKFRNLILAYTKNKKMMHSTLGLTYLDSSKDLIVTNPMKYRIKDIDSLPFPRWKDLGIEEFHKRFLSMSMIGKVTMPMILSRGCPYQCTFCSSATMWTTSWVSRDINCVIKEIKSYKEVYKIDHIDFFDLTAIVNKQWTIDFCKRLISENLNITWSLPSGTRSEALSHEVLRLLYESGCKKITYAPETGSERLSKIIKKRVHLGKMLASMRNAVKTGLIVKSNIIFGFPEETIKDRLLSFWLITKMAIIGVHDVPCFGFSPYPGSELFQRLLEEGKVKRDENYYKFLSGLVYTKPYNNQSWIDGLSDNVVPLLSMGGMSYFYALQFILRPKRIINSYRNIKNKTFQTIFEIALSNIYQDFWEGKRFKNNERGGHKKAKSLT